MMKALFFVLNLCVGALSASVAADRSRVNFVIEVSCPAARADRCDSLWCEIWTWSGKSEGFSGWVPVRPISEKSVSADGRLLPGRTVLSGVLDFPDDGEIWFWDILPSAPDSSPGWSCRLMNMPGERLSVVAEVADSNRVKFRLIEGSPLYERWLGYLPVLETARNRMQEDSLKRLYIRRHPDDELSLMFAGELLNADSMARYYSVLPRSLREGRYRPLAWRAIQRRYRVGDFGRSDDDRRGPVVPAQDFTLPALSGDSLRLSSLFGQGKYILLDFWLPGEWSGPDLPGLKACYRKYADLLEIVGVTVAGSREQTRRAVERNKVPWLVLWGEGEAAEKALRLYSEFGELGNRVLIDPQGRWIQWFRDSSETGHGVSESLFRALDAVLAERSDNERLPEKL